MPEFACRVAGPSGEVFDKTYAAVDEASLRRELETQDLMILSVRRRSPFARQLLRALRLRGSIPSRDFLFFNQELRALLKAGLPIVPSLNILLERRKHKLFRSSLVDVRDRVKAGEALSEAFAAQGELYPPLYPASLSSGERSGELVSVLDRFVAYMQRLLAIRRKVVSAMIYPVILVGLSFMLLLLMLFFIIPKFEEFLSDFGTELPLITKLLIGASNVVRQQWYLLIGGAVGLSFLYNWWSRTPAGRQRIDLLKMRIPLAGAIIRAYAQNRFTRTLATLQAGGIPLVTSLELSARAVGNAVFERQLLGVAERVREGEALWESLDRTRLLTDITVQLVRVGESTGALDEMLNSSSDFTDEEIDAQLTRMTSLIEPLMLIFIAIVVAIMLLSVYYPLIQAYGQATA
jgi:type IV pilus assembly protein PilC